MTSAPQGSPLQARAAERDLRHLTAVDHLLSHQAVLITTTADETSRALADPLRARIVEMLAAEQLCVCHIVELTGARQTNVSNHLRVLREAGLVETEPAGRYTYYRLLPEALATVAAHYGDLAERARHASQIRRPCP
jgi:ArsR family transcriptional regulator, arsenate/arsenite/antimonite-responsive transcriptional repressor